ncbi:MAG: hemolysin family protein [Ignavibacterium sp.]
MDIDWSFKLIIIFILLLFSGFFSGSEVALFSLDKKDIKIRFNGHPLIIRYLKEILEHPQKFLVTILLGNNIVNIAASVVAVSLALDYSKKFNLNEDIALTIEIIVLTVLVILFSELTPKVLATKNPILFAKIIVIPFYWIFTILFPISSFISELINIPISRFKFSKKQTAIESDELLHLAEVGHELGALEKNEHRLIQSLVNFKIILTREIMTPRVDVKAISIEDSFDDLLSLIKKFGYSRIPLYKNNLDEIIGIIYVKDVLPYLHNPEKRKDFSFEKIARKTFYVPETKLISDLMDEFLKRKIHIAIVVDEYGGTAGVITLEDIIEEIIGEIKDEHNQEEEIPILKLNENSYLINGSVPIDEINELLNLKFDYENADFETIGGFVLNYIGSIPEENFSFQFENYNFTIKEVKNNRIQKILIEKFN